MQPYLFPYYGYFQLIKSASSFVFYDNVQFIKGGWINRNRILMNGKEQLFTLPLIKASPNKSINQIEAKCDDFFRKKFNKTLEAAYGNAPFFKPVRELVMDTFSTNCNTISGISKSSIISTSEYLDLKVNFADFSVVGSNLMTMDRSDRLIEMTKKLGLNAYVNSANGEELYDRAYFSKREVSLHFLKPRGIEYNQFNKEFVPNLSIIDMIMFNSKDKVQDYLSRYNLL